MMTATTILFLTHLAAAGVVLTAGPASTQVLPLAYAEAMLDRGQTGLLAAAVSRMAETGIKEASLARLKSGLDALAASQVAKARAIRDSLPKNSLDRQILTWAVAHYGAGLVPSSDIAVAAQTLVSWPGIKTLRRNGELAMAREKPEPSAVVLAFGGRTPETLPGVKLLTRAHLALGNKAAAHSVLAPLWHREKLEARDESAIIREFGTLLTIADHRRRMERMLYAERANAAVRVADLAGATALCKAWSAVLRNERKAARKLLDAVPASQRSGGFYFAEARLLRRQAKFAAAAAAMAKAPRDRAALVDPDAWWVERRVLSRELLDEGDLKAAYQVAAGHAAESPASAVDAEFHAGWYALRSLKDAKTAARHFSRIEKVAEGAISRSRGYYWLGRAAEAGASGDARAYFEKAAAYGTTFYGQLAAERIGRKAIEAAYPAPTGGDRLAFERREAVQAIRRLEAAGYLRFADRLYRDLAAELTSPGELALLTSMARERGNHYLGLKLAKTASARGVDIGSLSHPVGVIPATAQISGAGKALAYAIARQESEFNVGAVSGAGARGLLQLLPGTAKAMAKLAGLPYSQARLTTDPAYNATLGSTFLGEQLGRFDGSYVLTFAGYNAGPKRARDWMSRYGDPRGKDIDTVVDWIERIPFTETRTYVQRVMENYQVYKMQISGEFDIVGDLVNGR